MRVCVNYRDGYSPTTGLEGKNPPGNVSDTAVKMWECPEFLKVDINELLFKYAPKSMTIGEFDELAGKVYATIVERCEKFSADKED